MEDELSIQLQRCIAKLVKRFIERDNPHLNTDFHSQHARASPELVIQGYFYRILEEGLSPSYQGTMRRELPLRPGESRERIDFAFIDDSGEIISGIEIGFITSDFEKSEHIERDMEKIKQNITDEGSRFVLRFTNWNHENKVRDLCDKIEGVNFAYVQAVHEKHSEDDLFPVIIDVPDGWLEKLVSFT